MTQETTAPGALSVLIVEDDEVCLDVTRELLEQIGVGQVHAAGDGAQGLRLLRSLPRVDAVLVDIYMPDMDGIEFMAALARLPYRGRVILVSGVSLETLGIARQLAMVDGIHVVAAMEKPLQKERLAQALELAAA